MLERFIFKIKRGDSALFRSLRSLAKTLVTGNLPLPRFLHPLLRFMYEGRMLLLFFIRRMTVYFYREPLFRGRCQMVGKRFQLTRLPYVSGHAEIVIGDDVNFFGDVDVFSGRIFEEPRLIIHNRVDIGHAVLFIVNKEIVIEDDVNVASGVKFMDTDAHPRNFADRIADLPPKPEEVKPIRICRGAWIGHNAVILKGVTVGEGAIIGVSSVVVNDIPPYSVAMGNPARVIVKNVS